MCSAGCGSAVVLQHTRRDATSVLYVRSPTYFEYCNVSKAETIPIMKFRSYQKWVSCVDLLLIIGVETIANDLLIIKKSVIQQALFFVPVKYTAS